MNEVLLQCFIQLITHYTGLQIREQDREGLSKKILARMKSLKLSAPETYYQLLEKGVKSPPLSLEHFPNQGAKAAAEVQGSLPNFFQFIRGTFPVMLNPVQIEENLAKLVNNQDENAILLFADREWKVLTSQLTTGESYFFRDRGQFTLLKNLILPELIDYQRKLCQLQNRPQPELRIWSAGCSTGEEPYSLAILLTTLIPDWQNWNLSIVGTDLNYEAIEKAKQGIYNSWSFRLVDEPIKIQYFNQKKDIWSLDPNIRKLVDFRVSNLVNDVLPNPAINLNNLDLILCRNVFVYFDVKSTALVLEKFYHTLRPGGYVMTAHAELHGQHLDQFQAKLFPESIIYQRPKNAVLPKTGHSFNSVNEKTNQPSLPSDRDKSSWVNSSVLDQNHLSELSAKPLKISPKKIASEVGIHLTPSIPAEVATPNNSQQTEGIFHTLLKESERLFLHKAYHAAIKTAEKILNLKIGHFEAYYLIAQAYANLGDYEKAKYACQQALSVEGESVLPYYILAHIAEEQGDVEKAKLLLKKIIYLVPNSINAYIELGSLYAQEGNGIRAKKMRTTARQLLQELPPDSQVEPHTQLTARELLFQVEKLLRSSA